MIAHYCLLFDFQYTGCCQVLLTYFLWTMELILKRHEYITSMVHFFFSIVVDAGGGITKGAMPPPLPVNICKKQMVVVRGGLYLISIGTPSPKFLDPLLP